MRMAQRTGTPNSSHRTRVARELRSTVQSGFAQYTGKHPGWEAAVRQNVVTPCNHSSASTSCCGGCNAGNGSGCNSMYRAYGLGSSEVNKAIGKPERSATQPSRWFG